jgi:hypothetical protein
MRDSFMSIQEAVMTDFGGYDTCRGKSSTSGSSPM